MNVRIEPSWHRVLEEEFGKFYFETLTTFVRSEYQTKRIYRLGDRSFEPLTFVPSKMYGSSSSGRILTTAWGKPRG